MVKAFRWGLVAFGSAFNPRAVKPVNLLLGLTSFLLFAVPARAQWIERIECLGVPCSIAADVAIGPFGIHTTGYRPGWGGVFWGRHDEDGRLEATISWPAVMSDPRIAADSQGNSYLCASKSSRSLIDLDPGPEIDTLSSPGTLLAKFDGHDGLVWYDVLEWLGTDNELNNFYSQTDIAADSEGNLYAAIRYANGAIDVDPGPAQMIFQETEHLVNTVLAKFGTTGDLLWAFSVAADISQIEVNANGRITTLGTANPPPIGEIIDLDPSEETRGLANGGLFVATYTAGGRFLDVFATEGGWISVFVPPHMALSEDGRVYVAGYFGGTVDFDPGASSVELTTSGGDGFVAEYDTTGTLQWVRKIDDDPGHFLEAIYPIAGRSGDFFLAGHFFFKLDVDLGPGSFVLHASAGEKATDGFLAAYDSSGALKNATVFGGPDGAEVWGAASDEEGFVYLVGRDFYGDLSAGDWYDVAYLVKASGLEVIPLHRESDIEIGGWNASVYPNPASNSALCEIRLASRESVEILVSDLLGRPVQRLDLGEVPEGIHRVNLNLSDIAAGQYFVVATTHDRRKTLALSIVR